MRKISSKIQGITVEIGGDTTKLGNALQSVNSKTKALQSELKGVNTLLKMDPSNITLLKQKQDLLNKSIAECREKLNTLKATQEQVQAQFEKGEITEEQYRDFQREIIATEQKLKSLTKQAKEFGNVSSQQIAAAGENMKELGNNIENAGQKMLGATTVIVAAGTAAIAVGTNFDDSMKQVAATMGITAQEIESGSESYKILEEAAKNCGETTKYSASEAASALNYLALAGYDAEKSAQVLPKVLNLAAAGNLELATASDMVTDAMAALNLETKDLDKYIDEMAKTSQKSNTSVAQLGEATLTCAGTVSMAKMSLETMNTELGILANNGIKGAEGGTHLRNIILSLTSPTDKAADAIKKLGIRVTDSKGNIRDLNDIMQDFNKKLSTMTDSQKTDVISTIFNKTDISAVNALIKGSGEEFSKLNQELNNSSGAAQNMADTMNSSLKGQLTLLKSQLEGIAIQISEILIPALKKLFDKISEILTWFSKLSPATKTIIVIIAGIVAAISPLLITIGKLVWSIGNIMTYGPKIVSMFGTIKTAISGLFTLLAANPIILIIAGIVALIAIFVTLWNKCEWFRNFWIGLWENIKNVCSTAIDTLKNFFTETIPNWFNGLVENFTSIKEKISEAFINFYQPIQEAFAEVYEKITSTIEKMIEKVKEIIESISNKIQEFLETLKNIADWINTNIIQPILSIVGPIVLKLGEIVAKIWEIITVLFGVLCQWIYDNVIAPIVEQIQAFIEDIKHFFQDVWNFIVELFSVVSQWVYDNIITPIITAIQEFVQTVIQFAQDIWNKIVEIFSIVSEWFSNTFTQAKDGIIAVFTPIIQWFSDRWNDIKNIFSQVVNFFSDTFQSACNGIKNAFSTVTSFFQGIWNTIKDMFSRIGTTIGNGIGDAFRTVVNSIISFAENTINKLIRSINGAIGMINNIPGVNISTISELNIPRLKIGMPYVPYDDYPALLHKGERVLTAKENKEYGKSEETNKTIVNHNNTTLKIEKFYNNRKQDIQGLSEELGFYEEKYNAARGVRI